MAVERKKMQRQTRKERRRSSSWVYAPAETANEDKLFRLSCRDSAMKHLIGTVTRLAHNIVPERAVAEIVGAIRSVFEKYA